MYTQVLEHSYPSSTGLVLTYLQVSVVSAWHSRWVAVTREEGMIVIETSMYLFPESHYDLDDTESCFRPNIHSGLISPTWHRSKYLCGDR